LLFFFFKLANLDERTDANGSTAIPDHFYFLWNNLDFALEITKSIARERKKKGNSIVNKE
jgi:hypothetical protein